MDGMLEDLSYEGQAERDGAFQPGKEKALGRPHCSLQVLEGDL